LAITQILMLASTVQFSRYGRSRPRGALASASGRSWPRAATGVAVPSGPNSVLGPRAPAHGVPSQPGVLAGEADTRTE
jgi:hypothetical protein